MPSVSAAAAQLRATLLEVQHPDGGWGTTAGRRPSTECTALASLALALAGAAADRTPTTRGLAWLAAHQRPDGSWPATAQVPEASWMTGDALLTLAALRVEPMRVRRAVAWLIQQRGQGISWRDRLAERWRALRGQALVNDLDPTIPGWSWVDGTFAWVEPTALALLALRAASVADPAPARDGAVAERVRSGERLLLDRMVPGGGWNYGNKVVLGEKLEPYPDTTAWALLALRAPAGGPVAGAGPAVSTSLEWLAHDLKTNRSPLARALAALAYRAHGRDDGALRAALAEGIVAPGGVPASVRTNAFALLALAGPPVPFGV